MSCAVVQNTNTTTLDEVVGLTVIAIGVTMDSLFRLIEQRTVNRWGMKF